MTRLRSLSTLQWALALSLIVHAALLSIRFVDPVAMRQAFDLDTLRVVLVNATSDAAPTRVQAVAQHSLAGGGIAPGKRMVSTPLPPEASRSEGDAPVEERAQQIERKLRKQQALLAQVRAQLAALPAPDPDSPSDDPQAQAREDKRRKLSDLLAAIERRQEEENARPQKRYLSPATLGVTYAQYYDDMRRKIEAVGTAHFPELAGRKLYGELLMALLINHDGHILDARVVRSSGNRALDRMAEAIAQKAAPFGPFTSAMRRDTDRFDVTARFHFTRDARLETTLQGDPLLSTVVEPDS